MDRYLTREKISAVREMHRQKMNTAAARAEMMAGEDDMKECAISSTESERHREAFVALRVALDLFDQMDAPQFPDFTEAMSDAFFRARDDYAQLVAARVSPRPTLAKFTWDAMLAAAEVPTHA
ncbi:hypothetical protein EOD42_25565 [Rhodovarius crocodyli]|uniref:Uncharacterized protein n=2 Tax=Rhodovarius crocodyli TaxID=1979269 RepID=A0A437LV10_9PROT|nr:hypothetical protein EOD42_25565 [Rhodovarius crocodyli]